MTGHHRICHLMGDLDHLVAPAGIAQGNGKEGKREERMVRP